jgi:hypothetical protein
MEMSPLLFVIVTVCCSDCAGLSATESVQLNVVPGPPTTTALPSAQVEVQRVSGKFLAAASVSSFSALAATA